MLLIQTILIGTVVVILLATGVIMRRDFSVGTIHESNFNGKFEIVGRVGCMYKIRFIDTGCERVLNAAQVTRGQAKDPMRASVYGVGYIGVGEYKSSINSKVSDSYKAWANMLKRCYENESIKQRPTYKGCTVCEEWHNFQNFAQWYDANYPKDGGKYQLDKDLSCYGERGKLYSPETCVFVTSQVNAEEACAKSYELKDKNGKTVRIYNMAKFCRENGLNHSLMSMVNLGKIRSHKGWKKAH